MKNPERSEFITPATTPCSVTSEDNYLIPYSQSSKPRKQPWYIKYRPPYAIISISILEVVAYSVINENQIKLLRFNPNQQTEVWRFCTYMLVHDSLHHLLLNVVIQCFFALHLENSQGSWRVALLYLGSGYVGALGAACASPDLVIGASAGVYALLMSHVADIILNYRTVKYKISRCISVAVIVTSDVIYNLVHFHNKILPSISWGAHVSGAVSGFLLGLMLYKNLEDEKSHSKLLFYIGCLLFCLMIVALLVVNFQIKKCTPKNLIHVNFTYIC